MELYWLWADLCLGVERSNDTFDFSEDMSERLTGMGETQKARKDILGKKNDDQKAKNQKRRRCWGLEGICAGCRC